MKIFGLFFALFSTLAFSGELKPLVLRGRVPASATVEMERSEISAKDFDGLKVQINASKEKYTVRQRSEKNLRFIEIVFH